MKFGVPIALDIPKCQTCRKQKSGVRRYGRLLLKSIWRHNSVGVHPVCIKFSSPLQSHMLMTAKRSEAKPEYQYGGRVFSETGSSNISAAHWNIWSTFGMLMALDLPTCRRWSNQKPEVGLRRYSRHLVRSMWSHNFVADLFRTKFSRFIQITYRRRRRVRWNRELNLNIGTFVFSNRK